MKQSRLLIDEQPLQVIPSLACKMGLNRAMFLQQLHYWLQKSTHVHEERRWIFNTYEDWHEQFPFWTPEAIRKIVSQLETRGVIETTDRFNKRGGDRTKWYTIDYETLNALFGEPEKHPDKSTEHPDKSTTLHPDKSTERYQRVPETTSRDSELHSGDRQKTAGSPPNKKPEKDKEPNEGKPVPMGAYAVTFLMERLKEAKERGATPPPLTTRQRGEYGEFFTQAIKDGGAVEESEMVLLWLVAKASGEVDNEPEAWAYFGSGQRAVRDGWQPKRAQHEVNPEQRAKRDREWDEILRQQAELIGATA